MKNLKFEDLPSATEEILEKLSRLEKEIALIKKNFQPKEPDELLTRQETADLLKVSLTTLWQWNNKGVLNAYGLGNRVYYKRSEVQNRVVRFR